MAKPIAPIVFILSLFSSHLLLLVSANNETFHQCFSSLSTLSANKRTNISDLLYTPKSTSFTSILHSSIQNLRFNSSTIPKPVFIVTPSKDSHVQVAVVCARKHGLNIRVRSGGHDYEGLSYMSTIATPFVIIDLVNLRKVNVKVKDSTAWVQAGALLGELYYGIGKKSKTLAFPAGTCVTIGVGGHFSGGGQGTLLRKYGLAGDNVIDVRMVDARGRILDRKTMGEDAFWAIRGGGGSSFGVILSWKIKLVDVPPTVTVFNVGRTLEQGAAKLIHTWQQIAPKFDDDLFIRIIITPSKNKTGGRTVQAVFNSLFLGTMEELIPLMKKSFPELGMAPKDCREMSWVESTLFFNDGYPKTETIDALANRSHVTKAFFKAKSDYVKQPIPENDLNHILKSFFIEDRPSGMLFDPYGANMAETAVSETPFPHRAGILYNIQYLVRWSTPVDSQVAQGHLDWISRLYDYMTPYVTKSPRSQYVLYRDLDLGRNASTTYAEASTSWGTQYFGNNFKKLAKVKSKVDPDNYFNHEQSIPAFTP